MKKKAISPLIGAILIIGFTVAIAAVVMFWSSGFIKSTTSTTEDKVTEQVTLLRDLEMKVRDSSVNLTDSTVRIKIENKNEKKIEGFIVKLYGTEGTFTNDTVDVPLDALEIKYIIVGYNGSIGNITKIEVIPKVDINQKKMAATLQSDEFIAPLITGAAPSGEFVADSNTVLLFHFDKDASDEGEAKEYLYDSSMVGWWHFNGDANDASGNGRNGIINGATSTTSGKFSGAYTFDGADDHINCSTDASLNPDLLTVEAWFNLDTVNALDAIVGRNNGNYGYYIYVDGTSSNRLKAGVGKSDGTPVEINDGALITPGIWYHTALVYDGSKIHLYLNGKETGTPLTVDSLYKNSAPTLIGQYRPGTAQHRFNGTIDEVAIYNRALSAQDIAQHAGILAKDYSQYGNNGTLNGTIWTSAGKFGTGLKFNGSDYVNVSDANSLDITNAITIESWVNLPTFAPFPYAVSKTDGVDDSWGLIISNTGRPRLLVWGPSTLGDDYTGGTAMSTNTWHHIAGVYDGANIKSYIDGTLVKSIAATGNIDTSSINVLIGARGNLAQYLNGTIDEVRISNIAREF